MKYISLTGSSEQQAGIQQETWVLRMTRGGSRLKPMTTTVTRPGLREMIKLLRKKGYTSIYPARV